MQTEMNVLNINELQQSNFRFWLQKQFTDRCKRNQRYSLRAFAKSLSLDASTVSQILSGKRIVSKKNMKIFCEKLLATPNDLKNFGLLKNGETDEMYNQINLDTFSVISEWYHYAILELTYVSGFKSDAKWIAKKLSITVDEAKAAIERLKRVGLLLDENGTLRKSSNHLTNQSAVNTSAAHRELQKQVIGKALLAIEDCEQDEKDITSMTMAINVANLPIAKELIGRFRRELCALLESGDQSQVYNLAIQLYPISIKSEEL